MRLYPVFELIEQYKDIKLVKGTNPPSIGKGQIYKLSPIFFHDHHIEARLVFFTQYLSDIYINRIYSEQKTISQFWIADLLDWTKQAQLWLTEHLGQPHTDRRGELFDEDERMSEDDISILRSWEYVFEWGRCGYYFDSLQQPGEIYIDPHYHYQIKNWDELISQAEFYHQIGKANIASLNLMTSLLTEFSKHFEYLRIRPTVHGNLNGLSFDLKKQRSRYENEIRVFLQIQYHKDSVAFRVARPDSLEKGYANNLVNLIKLVKRFTSEDFGVEP